MPTEHEPAAPGWVAGHRDIDGSVEYRFDFQIAESIAPGSRQRRGERLFLGIRERVYTLANMPVPQHDEVPRRGQSHARRLVRCRQDPGQHLVADRVGQESVAHITPGRDHPVASIDVGGGERLRRGVFGNHRSAFPQGDSAGEMEIYPARRSPELLDQAVQSSVPVMTATASPSGGHNHMPEPPFGRLLTAMVTPMTKDGAVDYAGAGQLADYLVSQMRNDGLVISGTTGESPTTTDEEKARLIRTVKEAVGDRAMVVAGVGTNDTAHTCELAKQAEEAGADGVLVVTPYYNKPPQSGLVAHFTAVADATGLPNLLYDIPGRTGIPIKPETLIQLAQHPRIVGVKDAKADFAAASTVMIATDLAFYSGDDIVNLPWLSLGAVGFISVVGHVVGDRLHEMIDAYLAGNVAAALAHHRELMPVYLGIMTRTQGVIATKAALALLGLPGGPVRPPLVDATSAEIERFRTDLVAGGVKLK